MVAKYVATFIIIIIIIIIQSLKADVPLKKIG